MRWLLCPGIAGCHHGRLSKVLVPPPPPASRLYGCGYSVSFQTPDDAIVFEAFRVTFVPPAASTYGDVAGQDVERCSSRLVSCEVDTPCAHVDDPASPAATTTVIPSAEVAASCRLKSVRAAVNCFISASQMP